MRRQQQGFTLIEILVAIALLGIILSFSAGILTALQANSRSGERLTVTQATTSWFEEASNVWADPVNFGKLDLLPAVKSVDNTSWRLSACTVDQATGNSVCGQMLDSASAGPTSHAQYADFTYATTATTVLLNLTYAPSLGQPTTVSLELTKK